MADELLPVHATGDPAGPPLILIHGFTQTGASWDHAGGLLARRNRLLALDAPGHGMAAGVEADLPAGADLMAATARAAGATRATWLGYSMGGRYALHVALRHPGAVDRLVLVSATAGIDDPEERAARRRTDGALADRIEADGTERFLDFWLSQPLFATLPPEAAGRDVRAKSDPKGWADSLRRAGSGTQEPLWDRLHRLDMPVLVVTGSLDTKYTDLAERLVAAIGANADCTIIQDAGHACHLEQPDRFAATVGEWLSR